MMIKSGRSCLLPNRPILISSQLDNSAWAGVDTNLEGFHMSRANVDIIYYPSVKTMNLL